MKTVSIVFLYLTIAFFCIAVLAIYFYFDRQFKLKRVLQRLQQERTLVIGAAERIEFPTEGPDEELLTKVKEAFEHDKVYLDNSLTIKSLAKRIGTGKSNLSKAINDCLGINFPTLLNNYRVAHALELFNNPDYRSLTIEAIGEMCGFNSRQVFHKAFKKKVGVPPRRFRE